MLSMLDERKYQPGQIIKHKLTTDKLLIVRNANARVGEIVYQVRTRDYGIIDVREEDLEDYPGY